MAAIAAIGQYLPATLVDVVEFLEAHGMSQANARMHRRFFGFSHIPLDPAASLADHLVAAVGALPDFEAHRSHIRHVIQARTMPVVAPHPINPLAEVCHRLGLPAANAFCLTQQACAGGLLAVHLAGRLLAGDEPQALALLVLGEKVFTSVTRVTGATGVMGEATAAVLVRAGGDTDRVLGYASVTHGRFHRGGWLDEPTSAAFEADYPANLAAVMLAAVGDAGLRVDQIDLILPHNINRIAWLRVLRRLGIRDLDRLYLDNLASHAHCFCADAFLNYRSAVLDGRIRRGDRCLMTAVGLGATFSAMVVRH